MVDGPSEGLQGRTAASNPATLAILRIPRLELEVPVYDGTTDAVLDLAAGRIEDTACPERRATSASRRTGTGSSGC